MVPKARVETGWFLIRNPGGKATDSQTLDKSHWMIFAIKKRRLSQSIAAQSLLYPREDSRWYQTNVFYVFATPTTFS